MATINAIAHLNQLTTDVTNDYYLTVQSRGSLNPHGVIERMRQHELPTKNVDGEAFLDNFFDECILALQEGYNINTPLFNAGIGLEGGVLASDLGHTVGPDKVKAYLQLTQSATARKALEESSVYIFQQSAATLPTIQSVMDPTEGKANHLNPGAMVLIQGLRIAVKGDDPSIGVTFTKSGSSSTTVKVGVEKIFPNTPTKLQFILPEEVTEGDWEVSITTQASASGGTLLKEARTGVFENLVRVGEEDDEPDGPVVQ